MGFIEETGAAHTCAMRITAIYEGTTGIPRYGPDQPQDGVGKAVTLKSRIGRNRRHDSPAGYCRCGVCIDQGWSGIVG